MKGAKVANKASEYTSNLYFSWLKDKRITDMFDAYKKINVGLTALINADRDTGSARELLKQAESHHKIFLERIENGHYKKSS